MDKVSRQEEGSQPGREGGKERRDGRGEETPVRPLSGGEILIGKEVREFSGFH